MIADAKIRNFETIGDASNMFLLTNSKSILNYVGEFCCFQGVFWLMNPLALITK